MTVTRMITVMILVTGDTNRSRFDSDERRESCSVLSFSPYNFRPTWSVRGEHLFVKERSLLSSSVFVVSAM